MVGNKKDTNILISFTSFKDDGSVRVRNESTEEGSHVLGEDLRCTDIMRKRDLMDLMVSLAHMFGSSP